MNTRLFNIPASNRTMVEDQIAKLNKRAAKLSLAPIVLTWGKAFTAPDETVVLPVTVGGPLSVQYDGWHFIATLQHLSTGENIIRSISEEHNVPDKYQTCGPDCEHCNVHRYRKDTYLVKHEDERVLQVGSTCIKDFLGGNSPDNIMKHASFVSELLSFMEGACHRISGHDESIFHIVKFLTATASVIRVYGWVSKKEAQALQQTPTATRVLDDLFSEHNKFKDEDLQLAGRATEWAENIPDLEADSSDYLFNIRAIARSGMVGVRTAGFAASIISAYNRWNQAHQIKPHSEFVGKIGDVITTDVTLKNVYPYVGSYGPSNRYIFEDGNGNNMVWFTSTSQSLEVGHKYTIRASIKDHSEYKEVKQTILTRCKVLT